MDDDKTGKRCVGTSVPGCPQIPSRRESHLHYLRKTKPKRKNRKHILTDFSERMCFLAFSLGIRDGKPVPYILGSKAGCLPSYFRLSSTATAWPGISSMSRLMEWRSAVMPYIFRCSTISFSEMAWFSSVLFWRMSHTRSDLNFCPSRTRTHFSAI